MSADPGRLADLRPDRGSEMAAQVGPKCYDSAGVRAVLAPPGDEPVAEREVELLRNRRGIVALPTAQGHLIYPTWQFGDHDVLPGVAEVLSAFESSRNRAGGAGGSNSPRSGATTAEGSPTVMEPWSCWSVAVWMTTPMQELGSISVAQWLLEGRESDRVVRLAGRTAAAWSV